MEELSTIPPAATRSRLRPRGMPRSAAIQEARPNKPTVTLANPSGIKDGRGDQGRLSAAGALAEILRGEPGLQGCQGDHVTAQVADPVEHPVEGSRGIGVQRRLTSHPVKTPSPKAMPKVVSGRFSIASDSTH